MARERRNQNEQDAFTFRISGTVQGKPYEGKNWDYYTVKVEHGDHYDLVRVASQRVPVLGDGERITAIGTIRVYYNKDKKCSEFTLYEELKE